MLSNYCTIIGFLGLMIGEFLVNVKFIPYCLGWKNC